MTLKVLCWLFLGIIAYTYLGYTFILLLLSAARRLFTAKESDRYDPTFEPDVSLIIPAHNEAEIIEEKVQNCRELDYPKNKLQILLCLGRIKRRYRRTAQPAQRHTLAS